MEYTVFWLAALIVFIVVEIATMGLTTIWFAAGALAAVLASALGVPLGIQITLFLAVSLVLLFFTRPLAVKYFNKDRIKTNAESLVGRQAIVTGEIDNRKGVGQVTVNGQEWSARTAEEGVQVPVGSLVDILAINGVKLIVNYNKDIIE
ncbi:MAG: NfeD family protein [Lachnospiraceae bacterium]|nr:NfeD family protein [Lachnospiraceae bacterium]